MEPWVRKMFRKRGYSRNCSKPSSEPLNLPHGKVTDHGVTAKECSSGGLL